MRVVDMEKGVRPVTAAQFGGGVFLRGFFDWMLAKANATGEYCGNAVIVRSQTRGADPLASQNYAYTDVEGFSKLAILPTLSLVVSNTTEAGIVYEGCPRPCGDLPKTFPARLAWMLYLRFLEGLDGLLVLPCELIEQGGDTLREIVLRHSRDWQLGEAFEEYVTKKNSFRNTLVDRIVSGAPDRPIELPYEDALVNTSEAFYLWVIEGESDARLPFAELGMNVKWVPDLSVYRTLKVRILNGAHTSMIPYALLSGLETVGDCMSDSKMRAFLDSCLEEILQTLPFDASEARAYADAVIKRFQNPYIHHRCEAIALNSVSKFRVRVLPSIKAYFDRFGKYPEALTYSFSRLLAFYRKGSPRDDALVIEKMRAPLSAVLSDVALWGEDLSDMGGALRAALTEDEL